MSRVGKNPIEIPSGVKVSVSGSEVSAEGPKGKMSVRVGTGVEVAVEGSTLTVKSEATNSQARANWGTARANINNMILGVSNGWVRKLQLNGVGYQANCNGKVLTLNVEYSHPNVLDVPALITCKTPEKTLIELESVDKALVGTFAAKIRKIRPPEPYLGKGIKFEEERIRRKAGKAGKAGGK